MPTDAFDTDVLNWVVAHRVSWLTDMFWVITTIGNTFAMTVLTVVLAIVLYRAGRRADAVLVVAAMASGFGVMNGLKVIYGRARPPMPDRLVEISTHSFPSGHAMMSAILATVAIAVMMRSTVPWVRTPATVVMVAAASLLIGFSRIYLAAHWTSDVLAGWVFGIAWGALCLAAASAAVRISERNRSAGR